MLHIRVLNGTVNSWEVKIFNSTRGGKLEEFPRIKIEDAINKIQC